MAVVDHYFLCLVDNGLFLGCRILVHCLLKEYMGETLNGKLFATVSCQVGALEDDCHDTVASRLGVCFCRSFLTS